MSNSEKIFKNLDKIFPNFSNFLSGYGTGDKKVADWDKSSMALKPSKSKLLIKPTIAKDDQRESFSKGIMGHFTDGEKLNEDNVKIDDIKEVLYSTDDNVQIEFHHEYKKGSESGSINTFYIKIFKVKKDGKIGSRADFTFAFAPKAASKGAKKPDPHELMTACLILRGKDVDENKLNRSEDIYGAVKTIVDDCYTKASKVEGGSGLEGFYMDKSKKEPDMVNFAKAYSASNYILKVLPRGYKNIKLYQTGQKWHSDISKFSKNDDIKKEIKAYNSSDIVIRFEYAKKTHFWGISLKKRGMSLKGTADKEPTLLNKPIIDILKNYAEGNDIKSIEKAKNQFFRGALKCKYGQKKSNKKTRTSMDIDSMSDKEVLKKCNEVFTKDDKSMMLRGQGEYSTNRNIYFEEIHNVFMKRCNKNPKFFWEFLDLVFRVDMDAFVNKADFHFSLITGTGNFDIKTEKFISEKALEKYGKTTTNVFNQMFEGVDLTKKTNNADFQILKGTGVNAFDDDATAAKLFYTMKIGKVYIVDCEVRYKGSLTSEPQFQVYMSVRSPNFSERYKEEAAKNKGQNRWG